MSKKTCCVCKIAKTIDDFYKCAKRADGHMSRCKVCEQKRLARYPRYTEVRYAPFYNIWVNMKDRCSNPRSKFFHNYGGRGIKVSKNWLTFKNFYSDMKDLYQPGLTLDRIDNNGGYSKDNCRWATWKVQQNNRRDNRFFTFNGKTLTLTDWAIELGMKKSTLEMRWHHYHWPLERCLTEEVRPRCA